MGFPDRRTDRSGRKVSGPVMQNARLELAERELSFLRSLLEQGLGTPIGRFSNRLPDSHEPLRGKDIFLTRNPGVFVLADGEALTASEFVSLVRQGAVLLNTTSDSGYGHFMDAVLKEQPGDTLTAAAIPPEYLVYDEARIFGLSFAGSPELHWLGEVLRLHAGVVKYAAALESRVAEARRELYLAAEGHAAPPRPFRWARALGTASNLVLPGAGFALLGDIANAVTWCLAVPLLAWGTWLVLGHAVLPAFAVWLACGLVAAQHTYRHWERGYLTRERYMAAVPVAFLFVALTDHFLFADGLLPAAARFLGPVVSGLPAPLAALVYGPAPTQYAVCAVAFLVAAAGLAARLAYDRWREVRYGPA